MTNEAFIGRKSAIWLWKEETRGQAVAPVVYIPKTSGVLQPSLETATDDSWYWVIDENYDNFVTKNLTQLDLEGIVRNWFIWYLFLWALGKYTKCTVFKGTASWWTPARGDVADNGAVLKKIIIKGSDTYYFFDKTVTGTSVSNGTWTITWTVDETFNAHLFEVLQNNNHPTFTLYDDDPVAASYAPYCMIDSFELTCAVEDYVRFSSSWLGKQMQANEDPTVTPAYTDELPFTASMAWVRFADTEAGLNTADELCMQNFRIAINKNLADSQCFGDTDVAAIYNQQFGIEGDFEAIYNSTTLRDMALSSTKKAIRFYAENANAETLTALYIDVMKAWLNEWTKTDNNNEIIRQTMGFVGQYDNAAGASIEILLLNWVTSY